jgi:N-acetylglucosamine malate deacetylase 1
MHIATFFAHPDDLDLWAGGALLRHLDRGDMVSSMLFYECNDERLAELGNARRHIRLEDAIRCTAAYTAIADDRVDGWSGKVPEVVLTHWNEDAHVEHRLVFEFALRFCHLAKRRLKATPVLLMTSTYYLRGERQAFDPDIVIDITATMERKRAAIGCYTSQHPDQLLADIESQNRLFGRRIGVDFAEGFIEYPLFGLTRSAARESFHAVLQGR